MTRTGQAAAACFIRSLFFSISASGFTVDDFVMVKTSGARYWHEPQEIHPGSTHTFFMRMLSEKMVDFPHPISC